jgi:co-chaperonin GroES (HSP10)
MEQSTEVTWSYPDIDPGIIPLGGRVLVQLRRVKKTTSSGIVLAQETRDFEKYNTQTAKVVSIGPLAFKKRDTMEPWPEGVWAEPGQFVRVPKYGGDRFEVPIPNEPDEPALFMLINDHELIAKVTGDPMGYHEYINR